jgi:hypothetical protein
MVDRTARILEQLPIRGQTAEGPESLPLARTLMNDAIAAIRREPNRMGAWRMVGAVLEARKAFKTHIALCNSPYGPLLPLTEGRPDLDPAVRHLLGEHAALVRCFDDLITFANRDKAKSPASVKAIQDAVNGCADALAAYEERYRALADPETREEPRRAG